MQRCRAKSKRSGYRCKNYAVNGWSVCRMHGAYGGPKTEKGRFKCKKSSIRHGFYSREAHQKREDVRKMLKPI